MKRTRGFTLVELLVVIAIITILASIVVPRVSDWLGRSRMAKSVSEIRGADLALVKMLADAGRSHFGQFFGVNGDGESLLAQAVMNVGSIDQAYQLYSGIFYELLRRGKDADLTLEGLELLPEVKRKLGTSYMELDLDAWGNKYQFYAGPCPKFMGLTSALNRAVPFRSYVDIDGGATQYYYTAQAKADADLRRRGNPPFDDPYPDPGLRCPGYPAPTDLAVYIWSYGADMIPNQGIGALQVSQNRTGGGDDINNWDTSQGWSGFY